MMHIRVLLLLSITLAFMYVVNAQCTGGTVDGCSNPFSSQYTGTFTPSCNRHDVCYGCGAGVGRSRLSCDTTFRTNMRSSCGGNADCRKTADRWYRAVRLFGGGSYQDQAENWCNEAWVRGCL